VTPPGIDPATVRLVAQCLNHYATPGPRKLAKQFNYFGCKLSLDGEPDFDKKETDSKEYAIQLENIKKKLDTQMKFHKVVARQTLLCGSET